MLSVPFVTLARVEPPGGALGEVGAPEGNANATKNNVDNINIVSAHLTKGGTDPTYLLARMKREAPDVVRLVDGEVGAMPTNSESKVGNQNAAKNDDDNVIVVSERTRGTDPTYLLARLERDRTAPTMAVLFIGDSFVSARGNPDAPTVKHGHNGHNGADQVRGPTGTYFFNE